MTLFYYLLGILAIVSENLNPFSYTASVLCDDDDDDIYLEKLQKRSTANEA
jgi:hypothetical protein